MRKRVKKLVLPFTMILFLNLTGTSKITYAKEYETNRAIGDTFAAELSLDDNSTDELASEEVYPKQIVEITTKNFPQLASVLKTSIYDWNQDGWLNEDEILLLHNLYVDGTISDITGIEYLSELNTLVIDQYTGTKLSINDKNKALETVIIEPDAASFTVNAPYVKTLAILPVSVFCQKDGTKATAEYLADGGISTKTKTVNLSTCTNLTGLHLAIKSVTKLTLPTSSSSLTGLEIEYSNLTSMNLATSTKLKYLSLHTCGKMSKLDTTSNKNLIYVRINDCPSLTTMSFTKNTKLQYFYIGSTVNVKKVDLSKCKSIKSALAYPYEGTINVVMPTSKKSALITMNGTNSDRFWSASDALSNATIPYGIFLINSSKIATPVWYGNATYYDKKIVAITKTNFGGLYDAVKANDGDGNGWLTQNEIDGIVNLSVSSSISDLSGLNYLTNLNSLCLGEYTGSSLTIKNKNLSHIRLVATTSSFTLKAPYVKTISLVTRNSVKKVNLSGCVSTSGLRVVNENNYSKSVTSLALPKCNVNLKSLELEHLLIGTPDLSKYTNLEYLNFYNCNNAKTLNVANNTKLRGLWFCSDTITKLNLSKNTQLEQYYAYGAKKGFTLTKPKNTAVEIHDVNSWLYEVYFSVCSAFYMW